MLDRCTSERNYCMPYKTNMHGACKFWCPGSSNFLGLLPSKIHCLQDIGPRRALSLHDATTNAIRNHLQPLSKVRWKKKVEHLCKIPLYNQTEELKALSSVDEFILVIRTYLPLNYTYKKSLSVLYSFL
jgi:hypothetical protein